MIGPCTFWVEYAPPVFAEKARKNVLGMAAALTKPDTAINDDPMRHVM